GDVDGGEAFAVGDSRIGAAAKQKPDDVAVAVAGGHHQRRGASAGSIDVRATVEQRRDGAELVLVDGVEQGSPVVAPRRLVRIGAAGEKAAHGDGVALACGVDERGEPRVGPQATAEGQYGDQRRSHREVPNKELYDAKYRPAQTFTSISIPASCCDSSQARISRMGTACTVICSPSTPPPAPSGRPPTARKKCTRSDVMPGEVAAVAIRSTRSHA